MESTIEYAAFVVVGGGIAGVTCVQQLSLLLPNENILLISASPFVKDVTHVRRITRTLEQFDVEEKTVDEFSSGHPNVSVVHTTVVALDVEKHLVHTESGHSYKYKKLCLCAGASPKVIAEGNPLVLAIRDTETVKEFQKRLQNARRIVIVGNGGIATELTYEIEGCPVVWAVKDHSIGATFFDAGAAEFFLPHLTEEKPQLTHYVKRLRYTVDRNASSMQKEISGEAIKKSTFGSALGPDWSDGLGVQGHSKVSHNVDIEYDCEVQQLLTPEQYIECGATEAKLSSDGEMEVRISWPLYAELSNGKIYGCDFLVSATGVVPNIGQFTSGNQFDITVDGGLKVNEFMETSVKDVYAAGDISSAGWEFARHWFQMRLWTQARQMGAYAARCIAAHFRDKEVLLDFCFEMFTHVTKFFGYKVVLLGLYNGQKLGQDYEILLRVTKGEEFVKVIMQNGRMQGCILVGETNLEETFENLILNQMDLSSYGEELLNPNIDIEDYFD